MAAAEGNIMQIQAPGPATQGDVDSAAATALRAIAASTSVNSTVLSAALVRQVTWMTCLMFFAFAMTTDAVGVIIPQVIAEYNLSLTQASAFHFVPMVAIGFAGLFLGRMADTIGRKPMIISGLSLYALACYAFAIGEQFWFFLLLLALSGIAIGIFKTAALALIGDISPSNEQHTKTMNKVEGFFGLGAIVGPALVTLFIAWQWDWTQLYLLAGLLCTLLIILAARVQYPAFSPKAAVVTTLQTASDAPASRWQQMKALLGCRYALGFSLLIACYVSTEVALFVWLPTLLAGYNGDFAWLAAHAITIFFVLRTLGRFLAEWILNRFHWSSVMAVFCTAIFVCYAVSMWFGQAVALWLMPLSGLFMSMIYPTLNSKGISCFPRQQHGAVAGLILAFTAFAAALAPTLMALLGDAFGDVKYGFYLATALAGILALAMLANWWWQPAQTRLAAMQAQD
jgi:fucose permease